MMNIKKIVAIAICLVSGISFANTETDKKIVLEKIDKITAYYMEEVAKAEKEDNRLKKLIIALEAELKSLEVTSEEIEIRKNLMKELYVDLADTKNLLLLEFDEDGNVKEEITQAALIVKESLGGNSKIVKIKLANGKFLPLIKYKVKKNDTLKKITLNTYPKGYTPKWKEIAKRIDTIVKINKNIIKMNYIYPEQLIYIPLFNDNPDKKELSENMIKKKKNILKEK